MAQALLFARNLICICIDGNEDNDYQGRIYQQYDKEAISFSGIIDMLVSVDELYDEWDFPQDALEKRHFHREKGSGKRRGNTALKIDSIAQKSSVQNVQKQKGQRATFFVQTKYRQDATWQGVVVHKEKDESRDFQSAMELIRIIDEVCR